MRCFVGIPMPEEVYAPLARLQEVLGCGRAVPEENLHLTLAFLGEIDLPQADELNAGLAGISLPVFDLALSGADVRDRARPDLVFVGTRPSEALERLQRAVTGAARDAGITLARRRFRPHVTIARFGRSFGPLEAQRLGRFLESSGDFALPGFAVSQFCLYRSTLNHAGPRYDRLAEYPLQGASGGDWP